MDKGLGLEGCLKEKKKNKGKFKETKIILLQSKQGKTELLKLQLYLKKKVFVHPVLVQSNTNPKNKFLYGLLYKDTFNLFFFQNKKGMLPCTLVTPMPRRISLLC